MRKIFNAPKVGIKQKTETIRPYLKSLTIGIMFMGLLSLSFDAEAAIDPLTAKFQIGQQMYTVNNVMTEMDAKPFVENGRTYVPLRYLGYSIGVTEEDVKFDSQSQVAILKLGDKEVAITIGSKVLERGGERVQMDVSPIIREGRLYLPARWVAEAFGYKVMWNEYQNSVVITNIADTTVVEGEIKVLNGFKIPTDAKVGTGSDPMYGTVLIIGNINIYDTDFKEKVEDVRFIMASKYGKEFGDKIANMCLMKKTAFHKIYTQLKAPNDDNVFFDGKSGSPLITIEVTN